MKKEGKQKIKGFLIRTQKYTQTDMIYLAKGGFWVMLQQFITIAAVFLLSIAFANLLEPVVYGKYKYVLSLAGILSVFSLTGIETALAQAVARNLEGSFRSGFKIRLKWGVLGGISALLLAGYYAWQGDYTLSLPLVIVALFLPFWQAGRLYSSFLWGKKLFKERMKYDSLVKVIEAVVMATVLFLTKNLLWLVVSYFASQTLSNLAFYFIVAHKFKPNRKEDKDTATYGKHLSLLDVIGAVANYLDQPLMFHFMGAGNLAIYYFAITVPDQIKNLLKKIEDLAFPKLATRTQTEIKEKLMSKFWRLSGVISVIMVAYMLVAPFLYKLFFPRYITSISYSQFYALSFLGIPATFLLTTFKAQMMKKEVYYFKIISPSVRIGLLVVLVPLFGIMGAVFAQVLNSFFSLGLGLWLFWKQKR